MPRRHPARRVSDRVMRVINRFASAYRRLTKAVPSALLTAVAKRTGEITQSRIGVAVGGYAWTASANFNFQKVMVARFDGQINIGLQNVAQATLLYMNRLIRAMRSFSCEPQEKRCA